MKFSNIAIRNNESWLLITLSLALLFFLSVPANAGRITLTSSDLPYIVNTNDTVDFAGTKITSATNGLYVNNDAVNVLIDMGTDTLVFGANGGDGYCGIRISRGFETHQNIVVKGGWVIHGGNDNSDDNACIELAGCNTILIDSVSAVIYGTNGKCLTSVPIEGREFVATNGTVTSWRSYSKNVEIRGGRYISYVIGYTSRCSYSGAVMHLSYANTNLLAGESNFDVHDVVIENAPGQGIVSYGKSLIYRCSVTVDCRNFMYTYPTDNFCQGQANSYCILARQVDGGSKYFDNYLVAGENYYGADGAFELEGCVGTADNPIEFYNNYINIHRGWDVHYGFNVAAKGFKIRRADQLDYIPNWYINIYNNDIHIYTHTDTTNFKAYGPFGAAFFVLPHFNKDDRAITIENNFIRVICLDTTTYVGRDGARIAAYQMLGHDTYGEYTMRNNHIESNDAFYQFGGYDPGGNNFHFYGDTLIAIDSANGPSEINIVSLRPRETSQDISNNYIVDPYCIPTDLYKKVEVRYGLTGHAEVTCQKTLSLVILDKDYNPVQGAHCVVNNNYGGTALDGYTDNDGKLSGLVSLYYVSNMNTDSLTYNDFTFSIQKDNDILDTAMTVNTSMMPLYFHLDSNYVDTIAPANTDDLGCTEPSNNEVTLRWTAPGDDRDFGVASAYDIRYATFPLDADNWDSGTIFDKAPIPMVAGTEQAAVIDNLVIGETYFFALRTRDEAHNWSDISNSCSATTRDNSPPSNTTNLIARPDQDYQSIILSWTAPGDDGNVGQAAEYDIRYSSQFITGGNWDNATSLSGIPTPSTSGSSESMTINSLVFDRTYYFALKTGDATGNWSGLSNIASGGDFSDIQAPAQISNLKAATGSGQGEVDLTWTSVGDDLMEGMASGYEFRYSRSPITGSNWSSAFSYIPNLTPGPSGVNLNITMSNLAAGEMYYFAVRAFDDNNNYSDLSNIDSALSQLDISLETDDPPQLNSHAFPNPFDMNRVSEITFTELPAKANLIIMTVSGRTVRRWSNIIGSEVTWNGNNEDGRPVASGTYLWFIENSDVRGKIIVIR